MTTVAKIQQFALPKQSNVKRIVVAGFAILAVTVSMYVYFVGKIVFDVVGRRTAEASIRASKSATSSTGVAYFQKLKGLDLAQAESLGLSVSHNTLYATRTAGTATVGMAHEL